MKTIVTVAMLLALTSPAFAARAKDIRIPKGQSCWSYQGQATRFMGHFESWSNVTVVAYGEFFQNKKRAVSVANATVDAFESSSLSPREKATDGSYPTPEGGAIDLTFVLKFDEYTNMHPLKVLYFYVCSVPETFE